MTVYLAFNEAEGLDNPTNSTSSSYCAPSGVARNGFRSNALGPGVSYEETASFTGISEGWIHLLAELEAGSMSRSGAFFKVRDENDTDLITLSYNVDSGNISVSQSVLGNTGAIDTKFETEHEYDIHVKIDGSIGFIRIYIDGILRYDQEGDTVASTGATTFDNIQFLNPAPVGLSANDDFELNNWGQVLVSDANTIGARVFTLTPTAGSTNDWASGDVTDVDEPGFSSADFAFTDTDQDEFTIDTSVTLSDPTSPTRFTAVVQTFTANYDSGATTTKLQPFLNDTTATSLSDGTPQTLTTSIASYRYIWGDDPADSSNWDADKINNYEFGLRAEA